MILKIVLAILAMLGIKKIKDVISGIGKPSTEDVLSDVAENISKNHRLSAQAKNATTKEEVHAALDALADADRK